MPRKKPSKTLRKTLVSVALHHYHLGPGNSLLDDGDVVSDDRILLSDCREQETMKFDSLREGEDYVVKQYYHSESRPAYPGGGTLVWKCPDCDGYHFC